MAKRFAKNEYGGKSRTASTITVKDIQTVTSETGTPLMYVVNYADNKGYTIISASKNYAPVLVYSDEGYMNVQSSNFMENPFINEYRHRINSVANEENDSLRQRYAIDWSVYEKAPTMVESRAYSDAEIQQKLAEARTYYSSQGYEVHSLSAAFHLIPAANGQTAEQRATGFVNDICMHTPLQYDCMDVTLFLVKRTNDYYGPYISTCWDQNEPYNAGSTNGDAGCVTIAVAQMMYYYKWPNVFDWPNIREEWGHYHTLYEAERNFMISVREQLNVYDVPSGGVIFSKEDMVNALIHYGYLVEQQNYIKTDMIEKIIGGSPVLVYGQRETNNDEVHVWICDGYRNSNVQYAAYMISSDLEIYTYFAGLTDHLGEFFHLNLGTGTNGWYYVDEVPFDGGNFIANRRMYTLTKNNALYE